MIKETENTVVHAQLEYNYINLRKKTDVCLNDCGIWVTLDYLKEKGGR